MTRHPALSANGSHGTDRDDAPEDHYVPEGWEELDRGVCPCGELVRWDEAAERWTPDRSMRLLVLTEEEAAIVASIQATEPPRTWQELAPLRDLLARQINLSAEYEEIAR